MSTNNYPSKIGKAIFSKIILKYLTVFILLLEFTISSNGQNALQFNGTSQYVTFGTSSPGLNATSFTLESWIFITGAGVTTATSGAGGGGFDNATSATGIVPIISKGRGEGETPANLNLNYIMGIQGNKLVADFEEGSGPNRAVVGTNTIPLNTWTHIAATYNQTTGIWNLYINGVLDKTLPLSTTFTPANTSIQHAAIGSALTSTGVAAGFFAGRIDEARIWNVARTQTEIQGSMNLELTSGTGLIGRWGLNETTGTTAANSIAGSPNGTLTNVPTWVAGAPALNPVVTPPTAPTLLSASAVSPFQINLSWTDNSNNETGFDVERSTTGIAGTYTLFTTIPANSVSYNNINLLGNTEYCYRIRAINSGGNSAYTTAICATTQSEGTANALDLGATGTYVSMGTAPSLASQNFTIETWFKKTGAGTSNTTGGSGITLIPIIAKGSPEAEGSVVDANYILGIQAGTNFLAADFEEGTGSVSAGLNHPLVGSTIVTENVWHHAAVTFQGGVYSLYLDGQLQNSANLGATVWPQGATTQHFGMGTMLNSSGASVGKFQGVLDEVRVWNYSRTITEIQATINNQMTTTQSGLLGRYGLNDLFGTAVNASAGTSVHGTISGTGSSWATPGAPFNLVFTPNAPTNLTATTVSNSSIQLNWTDNASNETGFEIERSTTGISGSFSLLTTLGPNIVTYADNGLASNSEYCYQIRAINGSGGSSYSNQICSTTTPPAENALSLGSSAAYVTFGTATTLSTNTGGNTNNFTVETWFKKTGTGVSYVTGSYTNTSYSGTFIPLVSKGAQESDDVRENDENYILGIDFATNKIAADFEEGTGSTTPGQNHPIVGNTVITDNVWHHAATTFNNGVFKVYLDGVLEATTDFGTAIWPQGLSTMATGLGTMINSTGATFGSFDGLLDEVRIWNVAKSDAEILANANMQITATLPGLIGRFSLNEGVGSVVNGSAGTTAMGNIIGTPIPTFSTGWSWVSPGAPFNLNTNIPIAPSNLSLSAQTPSSIQLNWADNSSNETGFEIVRSTTGSAEPYTSLTTVSPNSISYVDNTFVTSSQYCYKVRAINGANVSLYTVPACGVAALGEALNFGPSNAYVTFGTAAGLATPTFTAEAWFKKTGPGVFNTTGSGGIDIIPILSKGSPEAENSNVDANFILGIQNSSNVIAADFEEGTGSVSPGLNHPIVGTTVIANDVWHHAAVTFENGQYKLYLDGLLENSADLTSAVFPQGASIQHAAIGTMIRSNGTANGYFQGVVDEARIWSYGRTITEIQSTVNSQLSSSMSGLVGRWSLNEEPGNTVSGSAGTSFNGAITGSGWSWDAGAPYNLVFSGPALPAAPTNLVLTAISSNNIKIDWVDNANNETGFDIERSTTGTGGTFTLLTTVGPDIITFNDLTTVGGSNYCYRVRAINGLGASAFVGPNCISTANSISFQDGVNSYTGTKDTYLWNDASPATVHGAEATFTQDKNVSDERISLLKFDLSSLPLGTTIQSAQLDFYVDAEGQGFNMHKMLIPWDEATISYTSNGNRHFAADNVDAESSINASWPGVDTYTGPISVTVPTATIESWINNSTTNNGWLMIATHADDGQQLRSSEHGTVANRPKLTLSYTLPAPLPPNQPTNPIPAIAATSVGTSPNICADVSDPNGGNLEVKYFGRKKQAPTGSNFTIIGLPDTQFYTEEVQGTNSSGGGHNGIFIAQTEWIKANRTSKNIVFVTQLGDCVQNGDNPPGSNDEIEWQRADAAFSILENPSVPITDGIPYAVSVGNHDQGTIGNPDGINVYYNQYFGVPRFTGRGYYGGHYGSNNDNHYQLFSGGGIDFIHISIEYYGNGTTASLQPVLDWADALLKAHPNRKGIISSHNMLGTGNPANFQGPGQKIYDDLKDNPNLILMLAGHVPGEGRRSDTYLGNTVHTLMSDYQSGFTNGGNGWLRIMEFLPSLNQISVKTFSPYQGAPAGTFRTQSSSEFTIPVNLATAPLPFALIGTNSTAPSGSNSCINWPNLDTNTEYEWYVTVSDGQNTITGPTWTFTTGAPLPTAIAPSNQTYCSGETTSPISLSGTPSGVVFDITDGAAIGLANQTGVTSIPSFTAVAGSATLSITPRIGSTSGVAVSYGVLVNSSTTAEETQVACDSYVWHGTTYTTSGNKTFTTTNAVGCPHVITLHLTINSSTTAEETQVACDSYVWHGTTYTTSGDKTFTTTNAAGCPHVITLHLTINSSTIAEETQVACDSYVWHGTTYTTSGDKTFTTTNAAGCPHVITLHLTINSSTTAEETQVACDSYVWHGTTYTTSGDKTFTTTNAAGCPHVITLHLTINSSTTAEETQVACDSYVWHGTTYTTSGNKTFTTTNAVGCPHVITLHLTINSSTTAEETQVACDSYVWHGTTYTTSGDKTFTTTNAAGCPHVITLHLTINSSTIAEETQVACDSYVWHGTTYTTSGDKTFTTTNAAGCPHVITLHLTINSSTTAEETQVACDSYVWHGTTYTTSGDKTFTTTNAAGCPHVITLHLTINSSTTAEETQVACDSYVWHGTTYTTSGDKTFTTTNAAGCPHVITLHLTINSSTTAEETQVACDSYVWHGTTYTTSGDKTFTTTNAAGCPHVITLHLTINSSTTAEETQVACDSYVWHGTTYTTSGDKTFTTTNAAGCPHVITLHLTINSSTTAEETQVACDSYVWHGTTYTTSGDKTFTTTNAAGCPHVITLHLTINSSTIAEETQVACDSYVWHGTTYTTSGDKTFTTTNAAGCPHVITLHLTINSSTIAEETQVACDSYVWHGTTYTTSGDKTFTTTNAAGCPHVITLHLTINSSTTAEETQVACDSYVWHGTTYTTSGDKTFTTTNAAGCPHVITLHLTINSSTTAEETQVACDSYVWHGTTYTTSGDKTFTTTNAAGCPHVITLHLTINSSTTAEETQVACDSYVWHGTTYTTSGDKTFTTTNAAGCPHVITLHLTINSSTTAEETQVACDSYVWHGTAYTTSGDKTFTTTNAAGCPHVITLHLTINSSTTAEETQVACDSYVWHGTTYTTSGDKTFTTTNAAGCPHVITLHLTINSSTTAEETQVACDSYVWHGTTYTTSGDKTFTTTNAAGCPHVITLHLTINSSTTAEETQVACDSYEWHGTTYTTSGDKTFTTTNAAGCPHVITLHLTITPITLPTTQTSLTMNVGTGVNTFVNNCELIASINGTTPTYTIAGNTTAKVWIETIQPNDYVKRHYEISPALSELTTSGKVTLYFTDQEFIDYNNRTTTVRQNATSVVKLPVSTDNVTDMATNIASLKIVKIGGTSSNGTGLAGTYTGSTTTIDPVDTDVVWNSTAGRWEVSFVSIGFSGFFVEASVENPLPVTLVSFTVKPIDDDIILNWETNAEISLSHFEIEHSLNGISFAKINSTPAKNIHENLIKYQFLHENVSDGIHYYRLRMVDLDGNFKYSKILAVNISEKDDKVGQFYENPSVGNSKINIETTANKNWTIQIVDISGKLIKSEKVAFEKGLNVYQLLIENQGVNIVIFNNGKTNYFRKVIVIK